jgi:hypothetical protein
MSEEIKQKKLERNRELALTAFHEANDTCNLLRIAEDMSMQCCEEDDGFSRDVYILIEIAHKKVVGVLHQIDVLWDYLKQLEREAEKKEQSAVGQTCH